VIDYVFRALGVEYLKRDDLAHVTPEDASSTPQSAQTADPVMVPAPMASPAAAAKAAQKSAPPLAPGRRGASGQDELLGKLSGDAPFCDTCGHITVRNGTCYKCLNCGNSMGCS
jgi:ribonucleoside-diphosphate reductase alpha chain